MSKLTKTQEDALIVMRGGGGFRRNGEGFSRVTMSVLQDMGLVTYHVYENRYVSAETGRVNIPVAWVAHLTSKGVEVADRITERGEGAA